MADLFLISNHLFIKSILLDLNSEGMHVAQNDSSRSTE